MTNREAIEHLKGASIIGDKVKDSELPLATATFMAIEALEKQTPKKPEYVDTRFRNCGKHIKDGVSLDKCYKCPNCNSHIFHVFSSEIFCVHCGQALDWGETDD